jgi:hypothetical protein
MSAACTAWFYSPAKDRVTGLNVINKIVAGVDPPFCHVELQFPSGEACSIVMQGVVSLRKRPFDSEFYTPVIVRADAGAVEAALDSQHGILWQAPGESQYLETFRAGADPGSILSHLGLGPPRDHDLGRLDLGSDGFWNEDGGGAGYAAHLAHAGGVLYCTELDSVTLKRVGLFCFSLN